MRPTPLSTPTRALGLAALALLALLTPAPLAAAAPEEPPPPTNCWSLKTTICTDCADYVSKYCDPRSADGPFAQCMQSLIEVCPGFSCSDVDAQVGPPCD